MTPWQLRCCVEAAYLGKKADFKDSMWIMWHGAMLGRVKDPPPLASFIGDPEKNVSNQIDESDIQRRMKAYQAQRDRNNGTRGKITS